MKERFQWIFVEFVDSSKIYKIDVWVVQISIKITGYYLAGKIKGLYQLLTLINYLNESLLNELRWKEILPSI